MKAASPPRAPGLEWQVLIHQLPPQPLYLRAKIRNRLARVGAVALKNSVYVLPARASCLEDFQWIAQEATAGGGEAFVCAARFLAGASDESLIARFRGTASEAYDGLLAELARLHAPLAAEERARLERRLDEIRAIDFFEAPRRRAAEDAMRKLQETLPRARRTGATRGEPRPSGRTWVTRKDPHIDRLASAWLIRRFIDARARFRFVDPRREPLRRGEIGFDMVGAAYTHEGDRCTFETLAIRFGVGDAGVRAIAEIVHDLDLKDDRYARPATAGVAQLVSGLTAAYADDGERVRRAIALFDDLHASFAGGPRRRAPRRRSS